MARPCESFPFCDPLLERTAYSLRTVDLVIMPIKIEWHFLVSNFVMSYIIVQHCVVTETFSKCTVAMFI